MLDYLTEEVLACQPGSLVGFLLETSVLERLSGPLCDAVTGRVDSQQVLEAIERANLFLVPLDEVRGWWRYHHLFADLLQARLAHERPERVPELHRAAAAWHEQHGFADDAVRHALAAREAAWAARLVEQHVEELLRRSEGATLGRWLAALPTETIRSRARLCLAQAINAIVGGRLEVVEPLVADAERAFAATGPEPHEPSGGRALSVLANVPASIAFLRADLARMRGDAARAVAWDQQALTHLGEGDWLLRSQVHWNLGAADWLRGRLTQAEHALAEVVAERRVAGEGYLAMRVGYDLGQVQRAQGRLGAALATYQQWLEGDGEVDRQLPHVGMAHVGLAEVLYERDELDAAHDHATQGVALCRQLAFTQPLATGLGMLARIRQAQDDPAGALQAIGQAEPIRASPQVVALLNPVPAWRARLLLAHGEIAEAARWACAARTAPRRSADLPSGRRVSGACADAAGHPAARPGARAAWAAVHSGGSRTAHGQRHRVGGATGADAGGRRRSGRCIGRPRRGAGPGRSRRLCADVRRRGCAHGPPARQAGRRPARRAGHAPRRGCAALPDRLTRAFQSRAAPAAPAGGRRAAGVAGLVIPLSDRELQVLELLAAGKSNQQIADELVVVLDTAKRHVGHILDKLGAANRTQAVVRARSLGLLR